ncbi:adenosylcobinamide-GDP ribazoletransferase [Emcibacter nanhaiensis]|uniref:Adenosylcobinamide-GDP ribazoletransferase n=1 Tax=Emcibacter nanhaiensis TaxID=1505037 RepID=A0A501PJE7_9PROT|nr:adenosylcobinamide-GDP ribazoletransferase [Emcibacter nanhaiensis]TPD60640.1 adenosylcobinamide-GDP ribazoletransferase [Emcibacter nanhaiensis]
MTGTTEEEKQHKSPSPVRDIAAALMVLTRLPVSWEKLSDHPPDISRSLWAYPLVGLLVSAVGGLMYWGAQMLLLPPLVSILLALAAMMAFTGAFHEDGLADVADGFGGGLTRERKLEIMRDSRVGTYGALALLISIGLKTVALAAMSVSGAIAALLVSGAMSRLMIVLALRLFPPARKDGLAAETEKPTTARLTGALGIALLPGLLLLRWPAVLLCLLLSLVVAYSLGKLAVKQVGGITGDILGAIQQISEIAILLGLLSFGHFMS